MGNIDKPMVPRIELTITGVLTIYEIKEILDCAEILYEQHGNKIQMVLVSFSIVNKKLVVRQYWSGFDYIAVIPISLITGLLTTITYEEA